MAGGWRQAAAATGRRHPGRRRRQRAPHPRVYRDVQPRNRQLQRRNVACFGSLEGARKGAAAGVLPALGVRVVLHPAALVVRAAAAGRVGQRRVGDVKGPAHCGGTMGSAGRAWEHTASGLHRRAAAGAPVGGRRRRRRSALRGGQQPAGLAGAAAPRAVQPQWLAQAGGGASAARLCGGTCSVSTRWWPQLTCWRGAEGRAREEQRESQAPPPPPHLLPSSPIKCAGWRPSGTAHSLLLTPRDRLAVLLSPQLPSSGPSSSAVFGAAGGAMADLKAHAKVRGVHPQTRGPPRAVACPLP